MLSPQRLGVVTEELDAVKYRIAEAEHQRDMLTVRLKTAGNEARGRRRRAALKSTEQACKRSSNECRA